MKFYFFILLLVTTFSLEATSTSTFLPGVEEKIELALPEDFTASSKKRPLNLGEGVIWGKQETISQYLDGKEIEAPLIVAKWSGNVIQKKGEEFQISRAALKDLKRLGGASQKITKGQAGPYPTMTAELTSFGGMHYYIAWLGLNREDGKTLIFTYLVPDYHNRPRDLELAEWVYFLKYTK